LVGGLIAALLGFWFGLVQWLALRQILPLPSKWAWATGLSAALAGASKGCGSTFV
jgi:hypothetical protein